MRISTIVIAAASASAALADNWLARCTMTILDRKSDKGLSSRFALPYSNTTAGLYYPELRAGASESFVVYTLNPSDQEYPFGSRVNIKQKFYKGDRYYWGSDDDDDNDGDDRGIVFQKSMPTEFMLVGDSDHFIITTADGHSGLQPGGAHNGLILGDLGSATQFQLLDEPSCTSSGYQ